MKKNYVLDTNVLIHNPNCIFKFEENDIYIPHPVIEELDRFKSERSERGYSARVAIRNIISLRETGNLEKGVPLPGEGKLYLLCRDINLKSLPAGWEKDKKDNLILLMAKELQRDMAQRGMEAILVTNDANMMLKADTLKLPAQEYKNDRIDPNQELYSGRSERHTDDAVIDALYKEGKITVPDSDAFMNLTENEFITLRSWEDKSALCQYQSNDYDGRFLRKLIHSEERPYGIEPRNSAQKFMIEALLSQEQPLTIVNGPAGTGKTLIALGCGLEQVTESNTYKRVLVCRANVMMDEEIGFLPGSEREKIDPLLRGIYDNLAVLLNCRDESLDRITDTIAFLFDKGFIVAESLAYLRGRSICDTFIIIDEAQNCTPNQILSIITRAGEGTKIVLIGDVNQIDSPRLDYSNNGLTFAMERMKGSKLCNICSFTENESTRSPLAKEGAERLSSHKR